MTPPAKTRQADLLRPLLCTAVWTSLLALTIMAQAPGARSSQDQHTLPAALQQWGAITLFHGLPSDRVRAIAQDKLGNMWFGTDAGLARYDGRRTQAITAPGLPVGKVLALTLDQNEVLWVGTESGAARLVDGEFKPVDLTAGKQITSVLPVRAGLTLLASDTGLVLECALQPDESLAVREISATMRQWTSVVGTPSQIAVSKLVRLRDAILLASAERGLTQLIGDELRAPAPRSRSQLAETLTVDETGNIWLGSRLAADGAGLLIYSDPARPPRIESGLGSVLALSADTQQRMWVGTDGKGVFLYRAGQRAAHFTFDGTAGGLRSDHVYSIFVDHEGVVWFGTDKGVSRYDAGAPFVENMSANAESNFVRTLLRAPNGTLWCGTNRGLFMQTRPGQTWTPVVGFDQRTVYALAVGPAGQLLVGTAGGLFVQTGAIQFARASDSSVGKPQSVRALAVLNGNILVATFGGGLAQLAGLELTHIWPSDQAEAQKREVISLYVDPSQRLWIGTATAGVFVLDGTTDVTDPQLFQLQGAAVRAVDATGDGLYWLATSRGLYTFRAGALTKLLEDYDARFVVVAGARANSKKAWLATAGNGLLSVLMDPGGPMAARLDVERGLPSQSVFTLLLEDASAIQTLRIGTSRGIATYQPGAAPPLLDVARVISKRVHSIEEVRAGLWLEYPQNSLVLEVAATSSRTYPEQYQYAFALYASDGKMVKQKLAHDAQFSVEGLKPGTYKVIVVAYSADLVASAPLSFQFNVPRAPFPWTIAALTVLLLLALFALLWANFEHHKITRTSTELAHANQELAQARLRLANEGEAERRRIARDLHDQTLADLRRLLLLTDQLPVAKSGVATGIAPQVFRQEIEAVSNEIRRICEDLSPSVLENVGFTAALEFALSNAVAHLPEQQKFEYEFVCADELDDRLSIGPGILMQIYRIVQEVISNICRHAAATHVTLRVSLSADGMLLLEIEDNGRGFDTELRTGRGRGLANIMARASLIDADVSWSPRSVGGTVFALARAQATAVKD